MSIICRTDKGWVISHYDYSKNIYRNVLSHSGLIDLVCNKDLFQMLTPLMRDSEAKNFAKKFSEKEYVVCRETQHRLKKRGRSINFDDEINIIDVALKQLIDKAQRSGHFNLSLSEQDYLDNNKVARAAAKVYIASSTEVENFNGGNTANEPLIVKIFDRNYLIPSRCAFYRCSIDKFGFESIGRNFDFVLMDPPWWNKFIRRKKMKNSHQKYNMLPNNEVEILPISSVLSEFGLVGVWCTNAPSHIEAVRTQFFPLWGLKYLSTWFWIKVTQNGELIRPYGNEKEKRPYERIIFGCAKSRPFKSPEPNLCFVSVPSAIHSHKPPVVEIIREYLPPNPSCLELFARYLLPDWTSMGDQVLDLQHEALYETLERQSAPSQSM